MFFMITGFLFWSKAIAKDKLDLKKFYISRLKRIYPLYITSLVVTLILIFIVSDFRLKQNILELISHVFTWATCGFFKLPLFTDFGSLSFPSINGMQMSNIVLINAGVYWTLAFEINFYAILPFMTIFSKPLRFVLLVVSVCFLRFLLPTVHFSVWLLFLLGMLSAYLIKVSDKIKKITKIDIDSPLISVLALTVLSCIPIFLNGPYYGDIKAILLIYAVFLSILFGNTLFGLLVKPAYKFLGTISYSIYLLHGSVLFVVYNTVNKIYAIKQMEPFVFWAITGIAGLIVIAVSAVTYRFIEYPYTRKKPASTDMTLTELVKTNEKIV